MDMYDKPPFVGLPVAKLKEYFGKHRVLGLIITRLVNKNVPINSPFSNGTFNEI